MLAAGARARVFVALAIAFGSFVVPAVPAGAEITFVVDSAADAGAGTLRQAVLAANQADDDAVIVVTVPSVTLTTEEVAYTGGVGGDHSLRVQGSGATVTQTADGERVLSSSSTGALRLVGLTLTGGDTSACGGGVRSNGPLELTRSTLTGNASTCGGGGAFGGATVLVTDSTISGNLGGVVGGGLRAATTLTLVRSTVSANTAQFGAGVIALTLVADRSTLDGNQASGLGGGAYVQSATLTNSTVSGNGAGDSGGGVAAERDTPGAIDLVYSTVTGNTSLVSRNLYGTTLRSFGSVVGGSCGFTGATTSDGHNRSSDISCGFTNVAAGDAQGVDPLLGPLADNGGPTRTHAPQAGSPLLDAIPPGSCQAAGAAGIAFDQRSQARPAGGGCDIGSVEVRPGAQTKTWSGPAGGLWSEAGNWTPVGVPLDGDALVFPAGSTSVDDLGDLTVASLTGAPGATVSPAPGAGGVALIGGLVGNLDLRVPLHLPAGSHTLDGLADLVAVSGPGDVVIPAGGVWFGSAGGFDGDIEVVEGGRFLGDVGTAAGGLTIRSGGIAQPHIDGDVAEPIEVLGPSGAAELDVVSAPGARLTGPISLGADLDVTNPVVLAGPISGQGGLAVSSGELGGANTYAGGTQVQGLLRVGSGGSLGSGAVALDASAGLQLAAGVVLPNAVSRASSASGPRVMVVTEGSAELAGPVTVTGTGDTLFLLEQGGEFVSRGGFQSTALVSLDSGWFSGTAQPHSATAVIEGPGSASGGLTVSGVDLDLDAMSIGGPVRIESGSITSDAGTLLQPSTTISVSNGWLWSGGAEHGATSVSVWDRGELYLARSDAQGTDVGRLSLTGAFSQSGGSYVEFVLDGATNDQIRASVVTLDMAGRFGFFVASPGPAGHAHVLIDNTGGQPVGSQWRDAPEGSIWQAGNLLYRLSYVGGNGNDVTLTRLPGLHSSWGFEQIRDHGGVMLTRPGLSSWGAGRLDAWAVGTDRALWHRWEHGSAAGWESLGGIVRSAPAGVSQVPGQADVFARGADDALWFRSYRSGWGPWTRLGGILTEAPAVTSWAPGRIDIAARGGDGAVWHGSIVNGAFQGWASLGGFTTHAPVIVDWGPGQLHVFARGGDGALWVRSFAGGTWGPWTSLGGFLLDGPAVAAPDAGELAVFARGGDGILWHRSYESSAWSEWRTLEVPVREAVGATSIQPGEIEVGWRSPSGSLWTTHGFQPFAVDAAASASTAVPARRAGTVPGTRVDVPQPPPG